MKRVVIALVEGPHDSEFIETLMSNEMRGAYLKKVKLHNIAGYIRVALLSKGDQIVVSEYAAEGGFDKALKVAATLCRHILLERSIARQAHFEFLVLADEDSGRGASKLSTARSILSSLSNYGIELEVDERRWAIKYMARFARTGGFTTISVALVECSLECQVVKHVLKEYRAF